MHAANENQFLVSVKAVIQHPNDKRRLLLIKEHSDNWALPGGTVTHGETLDEALSRELFEELYIDDLRSTELVGSFSYYASTKEAWRIWIIYLVVIGSYDVARSADGSEASFIDIYRLRHSVSMAERRVHMAVKSTGLLPL